jgi:hypothetical protein
MEKSNIAFALITVILGIYIATALLLSRVQGSGRRGAAERKPRRS